jgi:hypothetical protein
MIFGMESTRHEDFQSSRHIGICVTIGRYWNLFKRLTAVQAGRFYQFEHIETSSSGKVVAKYRVRTDAAGFFTIGHAGGTY